MFQRVFAVPEAACEATVQPAGSLAQLPQAPSTAVRCLPCGAPPGELGQELPR